LTGCKIEDVFDVSNTISVILLLIFQNLKRSHDPEHIPFRRNLSFMH